MTTRPTEQPRQTGTIATAAQPEAGRQAQGQRDKGRQDLGRQGEDWAAQYLERQGFRIIERNWRCSHGEVDIVAWEGQTVVVCEVKTRRSTRCGHPVESVTPQKVNRLRGLTVAWLQEAKVRCRGIRIDVIGVVVTPEGDASVEHVRGVA